VNLKPSNRERMDHMLKLCNNVTSPSWNAIPLVRSPQYGEMSEWCVEDRRQTVEHLEARNMLPYRTPLRILRDSSLMFKGTVHRQDSLLVIKYTDHDCATKLRKETRSVVGCLRLAGCCVRDQSLGFPRTPS